jgi:CHAT domain-containing protein
LQTAQQALGLWQALARNDGIARTYAHMGRCYYAQSDLPEAKQYYERALQLWGELNNLKEQAATLIMLGYIENGKEEWSNSISLLLQAQRLIDQENEPVQKGQISNGLGDIFSKSGLPESSLIHYQQALDYFRQTPDVQDDIMTLWAIGGTYHFLRNYPEALNYLQQALANVAPDSLYAALCSEQLGRVYISMGEYPTALQYLQPALTIYTRARNPKEAARVRGLLGQVFEQQGQSKQAQQYYKQALEAFTKLSDRLNQAALYYALGRLELHSQNFKGAENYLSNSIELTDGVRRTSVSSDLTAAFSARVYERYEKYIECLMRQPEAQSSKELVVRAFETSEASRARSLAELLRVTQTNLTGGLDPKLAEQEKALRQALKVKEDYQMALLGQQANKTGELVALEAELSQLQAQYRQLSETIEARYPAYKQLTRPTVWDLPQIQEQVIADDQTLLLEYSLGSDRSYVWAVTRDAIKSYNLPARALINEAAQKVYKLLATSPESGNATDIAKALSPAIRELSQMILLPVATELRSGKRRIIIVADDVLHYIPFQILPASTASDEPLIASYEVINTPSASILGELRKEAERQQPTKVLAAFGDPVFPSNYAQHSKTAINEQSLALQKTENAGWQPALRDIELSGDTFDPFALKPLFYAKGELAALLESASGGETFVASGFAATREQLLRTDLTQYAILHFATHGLLSPKRPEYSGLVLSTITDSGQAQNGFVTLQDIYGLRAPVDLVVLSACQTALGKDVRGEGLLGLTRGFMYAGASSVVASLWKVDDEATAELMRQFYINMLQKSMTPAAALQAAQNSIRQRPEWHTPYYWAGFILQGEYRQVIHPLSATGNGKVYRNVTISAVLMLLAGSALWYLRRRRQRPKGEQ